MNSRTFRISLSIALVFIGCVVYALVVNWHSGMLRVWESGELGYAFGTGLGFLIFPILLSVLALLILRREWVSIAIGIGIISLIEWGSVAAGQPSHGLISAAIGGLTVASVVLLWRDTKK